MREANTCGGLIKQIHDELEKNANNALRRDDLTLSQISVLLTLAEAEGGQLEQKQLEQVLHIAQSTVTGIVQRLARKGFLESFPDARDKRIKRIRITPLGRKCCQNAQANMKRTEAALTSPLTEAEHETLIRLLQKIRDSF